jgi:hypothetical protein
MTWTPATRLAFRFCVVYLGLFCLVTQISGSLLPNLFFYYRGLGRLWPLREATFGIAHALFGWSLPADDAISSGEPLFFWVQAAWVLFVSICVTAIWSLADRRRPHYALLHAWFRLFVRFALAGALFEYGMTKVFPTQFPRPSLLTLVTPVGDLSLSALLWTSIGSSPAYEIFTGCVEVLGGVLLLAPRTTTLGALVALAAATQIFVLNMTYDIGLKLVSLHLVLLALFLLAPDGKRLGDFFVGNRTTPASTDQPLARTIKGQRIATAIQIAAGVYLLGMYAYINVGFWQGQGNRARSPFYGIWNVEELSVDGQVRPVEQHDYDRRWRRVILDEPDRVVFQRTDDSFARYGASFDAGTGTLALSKGASRTWHSSFRMQRASPDELIADGEMDGYRIRLRLRQVSFDTLRLLNSPFRWVRPHDP